MASPKLENVNLEIDKVLYKDGKIPGQVKLERRIVKAILDLLVKNGWNPYEVDGGDGPDKCDSVKSAMELIFNLDDAHVFFRKADKNGSETGWIFLVGGNGVDVLSDYTTFLAKIVESIDPEDYE